MMQPHGQYYGYGYQQHWGHQDRKCARCTYPLQVRVDKSRIHVDHCFRCGGTFLDWGKAGYVVGEKADPRTWPREIFARPPAPTHLLCPAGHGNMWSYLLHHEGKSVEIDACGTCHGMWLDAREAEHLEEITSHAHADSARPGASKGTAGIVAMYIVQLAATIPVEVYNPVKRKPILTYSFVGILTALYFLEIAIIVAMGGPEGGGKAFLNAVAMVPAYFERGYIWQLVTYSLLHGSLFHLIGNLYSLWIFGDNVEDRLGRGRYLILYFAAAIAGGLAHWAGNLHGTEPMGGASGAIAGLMGAYLVLFPRVKLWVVLFFVQFKVRAFWYMLVWLGLNLLLPFVKNSGVAWLAHVGGFVVGAALAKVLVPKEEPVPPGLSPGPTA